MPPIIAFKAKCSDHSTHRRCGSCQNGSLACPRANQAGICGGEESKVSAIEERRFIRTLVDEPLGELCCLAGSAVSSAIQKVRVHLKVPREYQDEERVQLEFDSSYVAPLVDAHSAHGDSCAGAKLWCTTPKVSLCRVSPVATTMNDV